MEVIANIVIEAITTRTSKLRKSGLKLGEKPTTESQKNWVDPVKTKFDGK